MKILYIISSNEIGGGEKHLLSLLKSEVLREIEKDIVLPSGGELNNQLKTQSFSGKIFHAPLFDNADIYSLIKLIYIILKGKYDLIHCHLNRACLLGSIAGKILNVPCVSTSHGLSKGFYYKFSRIIVAVSHSVRTHLLKQKIPVEKIQVIYNGIEKENNNKDKEIPLKDELVKLKKENKKILLYPARFHHNKNQSGLVEWFCKYSKTNHVLVLAGDGVEYELIKEMSASMKERILFPGMVGNIRGLMNLCDVLVFPSKQEAFPLTILEAMSEKLPVIASELSGIQEALTEKQQYLLFDPNTLEGLSDKIQFALENPEVKNQWVEESYQRFLERFTEQKMTEQVLTLYNRMIKPL